MIIYLPFEESIGTFHESIDQILGCNSFNEQEKLYLNKYFETKKLWCKAFFMEEYFTSGICSNQRVESLNFVLKKLLPTSSLQEVLNFIKKHETLIDIEILEEKHTTLKKKGSKLFDNVIMIKYFESVVSPYVLEKIKYQFCLSLNYKISEIPSGEESRWLFFLF